MVRLRQMPKVLLGEAFVEGRDPAHRAEEHLLDDVVTRLRRGHGGRRSHEPAGVARSTRASSSSKAASFGTSGVHSALIKRPRLLEDEEAEHADECRRSRRRP